MIKYRIERLAIDNRKSIYLDVASTFLLYMKHLLTHYCLKPIVRQILRYIKPKTGSYRLQTHRRDAHWIFFDDLFFYKTKF